MGNPRGGIKLRRGSKHAVMYAAQFARTARNKANRMARVRRRKLDIPHRGKTERTEQC